MSFDNEFDVVLNMADGAIGYLENKEENNVTQMFQEIIENIFSV